VHQLVGETGHGVGAALAAAVDPLWEAL